MAEVQQRISNPRGRGSGRGGRGGFSSRGGRPQQSNGEKHSAPPVSTYEDEGELGKLKQQYSSKLATIKEMFPDWTDEDIVFALQETGGDLEGTIERISEGKVSQWGEVHKKNKDRARSKAKEGTSDAVELSSRGGRGRHSEGTRGGRGRNADRGRSSGRGRGGSRRAAVDEAPPSTTPADFETPAETAPEPVTEGWGETNQGSASSPDASWEVVTPSELAQPVSEPPKPSLRPDGTRSWASMLKPTPQAAVPKTKTLQQTKEQPAVEAVPLIQEAQEPAQEVPDPAIEAPVGAPDSSSPAQAPSDTSVDLAPSKDQLTEKNLEQVLDVSPPAPSATAASTTGTNDPRSAAASTTPLGVSQGQAALRPGLGGYATTALKATTGSGRSSSFQRRLKEQQEAVVMPGKHAVDRAAVQFGSMGLNGDSNQLDVDEEREDAETRTQPPQHSPVAPRASLPPAPQQPSSEQPPVGRTQQGVSPAMPQLNQSQRVDPSIPTGPSQTSTSSYNQFYSNQEGHAPATSNAKAFEPFAQQAQQPSGQQATEGYHAQSQGAAQQGHVAPQSQPTSITSASNEYSSYYTSDNQRNTYGSIYGSYGQPGQAAQESGTSQPRVSSGFGSTASEQPSLHATSLQGQSHLGRFGAAAESQNSGHSTPNPPSAHQAQSHGQGQGHQSQQVGQGHGQSSGHHGGYPYAGNPYYSPYNYANYMAQVSQHSYGRDRPMFDDVRRYDDQYLSQNHHFGYGGSHGGYGGGPYGGAGKYGQPHQGYGVSPQTSFDPHSASPANTGGYGQQPSSGPTRETTSSIGSYGRTGSAQPSESQQHGNTGFGGMQDVFGRPQSNFSGQSSQQQGGQQGGTDDSSRGFGETSKVPGGPSPVPASASARPGSAANGAPGQGGLPTSQAAQSHQSYGYPSQMGQQVYGQQSHHSGGGMGNLGSHQNAPQSHQGSGYGGAYGAGFGGYNYASSNRGGWGGNYGH